MSKNRISKIIHYCWFGRGEKPEIVKKCISSWKKNLKDYEIKEWNEDSFDINSNNFVREAYDNNKYAFVSDYVRVYAALVLSLPSPMSCHGEKVAIYKAREASE